MVSLVDIGPLRDKVTIRNQVVETQGASAAVIFELLADSDELRRIFAERSLEGDMVMSLIQKAPLAIAQLIAAGTGKMGDAPTIEYAFRELTAGEQYDLVKSILGMTFPRGLRSFVEELTALARRAEERGWVQGTRSPAPSSAAPVPDTASTSAGDTPQDSSLPTQS